MTGRGAAESLTVEVATENELSYVMGLMRANRESVGGLPKPAVRERIARGTLLLSRLNGEPCGYLMYDYRNGTVRIPQACIQYDARRRKYGEALVRRLMERHADAAEVTLRCAADLESNVFWRDMGFTCVGTSRGGARRGRTINSWAMWLTPRLLSVDDIRVTPVAEIRQDSMYDDTDFLTDAPKGFAPPVLLPKIAWANRKDAA